MGSTLGLSVLGVPGHICGSRDSRREWAKSLSLPHNPSGWKPRRQFCPSGVQTRAILEGPDALQSAQEGRRQGDGEGWSGVERAGPHLLLPGTLSPQSHW